MRYRETYEFTATPCTINNRFTINNFFFITLRHVLPVHRTWYFDVFLHFFVLLKKTSPPNTFLFLRYKLWTDFHDKCSNLRLNPLAFDLYIKKFKIDSTKRVTFCRSHWYSSFQYPVMIPSLRTARAKSLISFRDLYALFPR